MYRAAIIDNDPSFLERAERFLPKLNKAIRVIHIADDFLLEEKVQEWINDNNPYAMRHMTGRLLEAIDRSMWKPDPQTREQLESLYLDSDEFMESE